MRLVFPAVLMIGLCAGSACAQSDDQTGAYGQLQNATSGNQTLQQTYGDTGHDESCPSACPSGNTNVPDPGPPQPDTPSSDQNNNGSNGSGG